MYFMADKYLFVEELLNEKCLMSHVHEEQTFRTSKMVRETLFQPLYRAVTLLQFTYSYVTPYDNN